MTTKPGPADAESPARIGAGDRGAFEAAFHRPARGMGAGSARSVPAGEPAAAAGGPAALSRARARRAFDTPRSFR